jgi:hypothetical protein
MGAWPTDHPHALTPCASTHREGGRAHPRLHDSMAPKENVRPTTSLRMFSPKKSMMQFPQRRKCELDKENPPIFPTVVHVSLYLYRLHKRPSTTVWSSIPDHTLAVGGYWEYDPLIDDWLRPLRNGEPHSFLFSEEERVCCMVKSFPNCIQHSLI